MLIAQRAFRNNLRILVAGIVKYIGVLIMSIMLTLVFHNLGLYETSIRNRIGFMFIYGTFTAMQGVEGMLLVFPDE